MGEITYVSGRILGPTGDPIRNAIVEIWEADTHGIYIHSRSGGDKAKQDKNFQGYGRFLTGSSGEYLFRTIKPVAYTGRCPHIHYAIKLPGREKWTTELHIRNDPRNATDGVTRSVQNPDAICADFTPIPGAKAGELSAKYDIVMGFAPEA
ncbi:MAG: hypothetical protein WDN28_15255 [Chthoniobacter sp.]